MRHWLVASPRCASSRSTLSLAAFRAGFGSLIQNPGFEHSGRVKGFIRGYRRVFWQASTDHRGTPQVPGRVATLTPDPASKTVRATWMGKGKKARGSG